MSTKDTAAAIASIAAKVSTIGQARAVLGTASDTLAQAYYRLADITTTAGLRDAARSRLDSINAFAQRTYRIWNDDPLLQDEEISAVNAAKVGIALAQANDALRDVEKLANEDFWNFTELLEDALRQAGAIAAKVVQSLTNAVVAGGAAFVWGAWPTLLAIGVAAYIFRKPIGAALRKATA